MKLFGLIGHPLSHSFSKQYFENKFLNENIEDCTYKLYDLKKITEFLDIVKNNANLIGLNVTIPYKETILPFLNDLDPIAKEIGAVNTIKINPDTQAITGFNTDYFGFQKSIKPFLNNQHERALILGTGGASKAIKHVLNTLNIDYLSVSRTPSQPDEIAYHDVNDYVIKHHQIIINTTPLGTFPNIEEHPNIPYSEISSKHLMYDLVYNPEMTIFLRKGKEMGALTMNGLQMLKLQAEKSWEIWNS